MRDFHDFPIFSQFLRTDIRPVIPKFAQEPVGIQPFHLVYNVLEQIIQQKIGGFQTSLETKVELPVITIHLIIIFRIVLPDFTSLCQMKPGRMFLEELLHLRHLQNTIIEVGKAFIPGTGTTFFHYFCNHICINDLITDFRHQLCQNDFIDTRETFRIHQIL